MKKSIVVALAILLALSLLTACGGNSNTPANTSGGNNAANSPVISPSENPSGGDDPCPCCPNCIQKECECADCGDSDDCECKSPGGLGEEVEYTPITYNVEITTEWECGDPECIIDGCRGETRSDAEVTMDWKGAGTGYVGSARGIGEYLYLGNHFIGSDHLPKLGLVEPGTQYDFFVELNDPSDGTNIRVCLLHGEVNEVPVHWPGGEQTVTPGVMAMLYILYSGGADKTLDVFLDGVASNTECAVFELSHSGDLRETFTDNIAGYSITVTLTRVG